MTHAMPTCCQATASTPPRDIATLPGSVARPEGPLGLSLSPSRAAACHSATIFLLCLCGTAWGNTFPLTCPPRRANAVQEVLPKQIMRWSARR